MAKSPRFYIFHGEDEFTQKETLADLKNRLGDDPAMVELNTTTFDGHRVRINELLHVCSSFPFLSEKRLVVVEGLLEHLRKDRKTDRKALLEYLPTLPATTRLVFLEKIELPANDPFLKLANGSDEGYTRLFALLRGRGLERWIVERVKAGGGSIQPAAVASLVTGVGDNLRLLNLELDKLLSYTRLERPIQLKDVELLSPFSTQTSIFELVDAIGQQNGKKAITLLREKQEAGEEPHYLLAMIVRQFRLLLQVKEKMGQRLLPKEISREVGMHPYVAEKLSRQALNFSLTQLEAIYRLLLDADVASKTGEMDLPVALELLVVRVAQGDGLV